MHKWHIIRVAIVNIMKIIFLQTNCSFGSNECKENDFFCIQRTLCMAFVIIGNLGLSRSFNTYAIVSKCP